MYRRKPAGYRSMRPPAAPGVLPLIHSVIGEQQQENPRRIRENCPPPSLVSSGRPVVVELSGYSFNSSAFTLWFVFQVGRKGVISSLILFDLQLWLCHSVWNNHSLLDFKVFSVKTEEPHDVQRSGAS